MTHQMGLARRMEREWQSFATSRTTTTTLHRWAGSYPALAGFADLAEVGRINRPREPR